MDNSLELLKNTLKESTVASYMERKAVIAFISTLNFVVLTISIIFGFTLAFLISFVLTYMTIQKVNELIDFPKLNFDALNEIFHVENSYALIKFLMEKTQQTTNTLDKTQKIVDKTNTR